MIKIFNFCRVFRRGPKLFKTGARKERLLLYYATVTVSNKRIIPITEYLSAIQIASAITN